MADEVANKQLGTAVIQGEVKQASSAELIAIIMNNILENTDDCKIFSDGDYAPSLRHNDDDVNRLRLLICNMQSVAKDSKKVVTEARRLIRQLKHEPRMCSHIVLCSCECETEEDDGEQTTAKRKLDDDSHSESSAKKQRTE